MRVATEGVNATVSGSSDGLDAFRRRSLHEGMGQRPLQARALHAQQLWPALSCWTRRRVVWFWRGRSDAVQARRRRARYLLEPHQFRERMMEKDAVLVDVRNAYETNIGAFPARSTKTRTFADFQQWLGERRDAKRLQRQGRPHVLHGRRALRAGDGGVKGGYARAERDGVFHLQGGIVSYMDEGLEGFAGANYVFDRRNRHGAAPRGSDQVLGSAWRAATVGRVQRVGDVREMQGARAALRRVFVVA